jgi:hypothetical protein
LVLLQEVDIQPAFLHILDYRTPCEGNARRVVETEERAMIWGKEEQPVAAIARLRAVLADDLQHRFKSQAVFLAGCRA